MPPFGRAIANERVGSHMVDNLAMDIEARSLTDRERAVLELLLSRHVEGVTPLREQARDAVVTGRCNCGCPTIHLTPKQDAPLAQVGGRLWPVEGRVDPVGDEPGQEIILFVDNGKMSSLELVFYSKSVPIAWPDVSRIKLYPAR